MHMNSFQNAEKGDHTDTQLEFISNVRLGPPSSTEPLIDVTRGPVFKFHAQLRNLKEKVLIFCRKLLNFFNQMFVTASKCSGC